MRLIKFAPALLSTLTIAAGLAFFAGSASAENIIVTRSDDPAQDGCDVNGCSFREAVTLGNTTAGVQVIEVGDREVDLTSTVNITGDMTVLGLNTDDSALRAMGDDIQIFNVSASGNVTFEKVWIYGASASGPGQCGGAIYNAGTLSTKGSRIAKNFIDGRGAGVCNLGTATLNNTTMSANNSGDFTGGAIYNSGTMTVADSTITQNDAIEGGGIFNADGGTLTITHSTISDNTADSGCDDCDSGGGLATEGDLTVEYSTFTLNTADNGAGLVSRGDTTIRRSTFSGNSGGAINNSDGTMTLVRSTISNNTGTLGSTAGVAGISNNSTLSIINSTIADNPASGFAYGGLFTSTTASSSYKATIFSNNGTNCHTGGNQTSQGYNVFSPMTNNCKTTGTGDTETDNARIMALADNGGPTQTRQLMADSPAINRGGCVAGPDQRGALISDGQCDAGAVELSGTPPTASPQPTGTPPPAGYPMGDASCNDSVGQEDIIPALELAAKLAEADDCGRDQLGCFNYEGECYPPWVDPNCDDKMTAVDVVLVAAHVAGAPIEAGCVPVGEYIGFACTSC